MAPPAAAGARTGTGRSNDDSNGTPLYRREAPRLDEWILQARNEDPYVPGQDMKKRNKALLASLDDLMGKITPDHGRVADGVASL